MKKILFLLFSLFLLNATLLAVDTDGDTILNINDLDDDNDGILDTTEGFIDFSNINDIFNMAGDATSISTQEIQITKNETSQAGSVMSHSPISLHKDFGFSYQIWLGDETSWGNGADGIAFILHNDPRGSSAVGGIGQGMGATGIVDGIYIEFDTYNNGSGSRDISQDHTQIRDTDLGTTELLGDLSSSTSIGQLEDSQWHTVQVNWSASTSTLSYSITE